MASYRTAVVVAEAVASGIEHERKEVARFSGATMFCKPTFLSGRTHSQSTNDNRPWQLAVTFNPYASGSHRVRHVTAKTGRSGIVTSRTGSYRDMSILELPSPLRSLLCGTCCGEGTNLTESREVQMLLYHCILSLPPKTLIFRPSDFAVALHRRQQ